MFKQGLVLFRPLPKRKGEKSIWINERCIRWKNTDKICWIKSKSLLILNKSR